jgi:hypothetical protein
MCVRHRHLRDKITDKSRTGSRLILGKVIKRPLQTGYREFAGPPMVEPLDGLYDGRVFQVPS